MEELSIRNEVTEMEKLFLKNCNKSDQAQSFTRLGVSVLTKFNQLKKKKTEKAVVRVHAFKILCPHCGYKLGHIGKFCPECGNPIRKD